MMTRRMDWSSDAPILRLKSLLGPTPKTPWAALIPQLLLWCFRRFCIQHLLNSMDGPLLERIWTDYTEFIRVYSPKGLETVAVTWIQPENLTELVSPVEDYNQFCVDILASLDTALKEGDTAAEDAISEFLDAGIPETLFAWLGGQEHPFRLFPNESESDDVVSSTQFIRLIQNLIKYAHEAAEAGAGAKPVAEEPKESPPAAAPAPPVETIAPPPAPEPPATPQKPEPTPEPTPEPPAVKPIARALHRRRTLRAGNRRPLPITPVKGHTSHHRTRRALRAAAPAVAAAVAKATLEPKPTPEVRPAAPE